MEESRSFGAPLPADSPVEDAVLLSTGPDEVARTVLYLSWLRSVGLVMHALADRFPDSASWEAQLADATLHEEVAAFNSIVADVRAIGAAGGGTLDALEAAGGQHINRALEALALTSERLGVTPDDLLVVLVHA